MADDDIVITGFSGYFPQADHLREFQEKLYAGVDLITDDDSRWPRGILGLPKRIGKMRDLSKFDAQFFGVHQKQMPSLDPQVRLLLETSYEAIVDAGYDPASLRGRNIGVFIGASLSETSSSSQENIDKMNGFPLLGCCLAMFSNRISYALGFHGPSYTVDSACSSAMTAMYQAMLSLRAGHCEAAIVGGSSLLLNPILSLNFNRLRMLSEDGKCKSFDSRGNGFARSEAAGAFFLQRRSEARRVYAKVIYVMANADGAKTKGVTFPSAKAQEKLLRETYIAAKVDPNDIVYVEAHGTGTKVGDTQELRSISAFFCHPGRKKPLKIGSVKSNMGHSESASAIPALAKAILALETGVIAANLHFTDPMPDIPALHDGSIEVVHKPTPLPAGPIGVSSYGFGGANAHTILEANPGPHVDSLPRERPELPRLVLMAGRSKEALSGTLDLLEEEGPYPDSAYALLNKVGQPSVNQFPLRGFAVVPVDGTGKEVVKAVEHAPFEKRPLWFVFTGMGCQWNGMARDMMQFDIFARSIRKSHEVLNQFDVDLIDLLTSDKPANPTMVSPFVCIAAVQVALIDMLTAMGIPPDGIVGHSTGEIGCSYADGGVTAEQAVLCAYWRGRCSELSSPQLGAMAAVGLTWEQAAKRCRNGVELACHNAEDSVTVSGPADAVAELVEELKAENIFAREVDSLNVAFHSSHTKNIGPPLLGALKKVLPDPKPRTERWVSSSLPENLWDEPIAKQCSPDYHLYNFLSPVLFHEALQHAPSDAIFLEIAPHCLLQAILRRALGSKATCLGLMKRGADNLSFFLSALGKLHTLGVQMDLSPLYPPVPWPVPRGTPNISHLVSWDHSKKWNFCAWDEFPWAQTSKHVFEIDLKDNKTDAYLKGHQVDGRVLFPATGYLVLTWKSLTRCCPKPFDQVPVAFEDVTIDRATVLPKSGPIRIVVNIMSTSGEFEVSEGGTVVATGRVRMAEQGVELLDKEPPGAPSEEVEYDLDAEDIYKELRLRGYEYHGAFRGILKADTKRPCGKLKWENNWVTFLDSMLQMSVLSSPLRTFYLPVRIQSCKVDPKVQARCVEAAGEEGLDVVYDSCLNSCRAGGVAFRGLKAKIAPRRPVKQAPLLEEYNFVPYIDDEHTKLEREAQMKEYVEVCSSAARRIAELYGKNAIDIRGITDAMPPATEKLLTKFLNDLPEDRGVLHALNAVLEKGSDSGRTLEDTVQSVLATKKEAMQKDLLNTALLKGALLRQLLDIVVENTDAKKIQVLELVTDGTKQVLASDVIRLMSLTTLQIKTDYTVAVESPDSVTPQEIPETVRTLSWQTASETKNGLPEADLILATDFGSGSQAIDSLAKELSCHCKERGFVLFAYRTALSPAERFVSTVAEGFLRVYATETVQSVFSAHGLRVVALRSNNLSTLLLLRKISAPIEATKQEVVMVKRPAFDWVESLKEKALEYQNKPAGENVWIVAEDPGLSGVVGLTTCLRQEPCGSHIRCVFDASLNGTNKAAKFIPNDPDFKELLEKDLVMNIYKDGQWGSYRHVIAKASDDSERPTDLAYLNIDSRGDLSTLKWYESPLRYAVRSAFADAGKVLCSVYYAPLNFHDIMLATGKLPPDESTGDLATSECLLGLEFSGRDRKGRRVMGAVPSHGIATAVAADPGLLWEVPDAWSLEDASTIPVAYATAYYALLVRGNMRPGESVLIHSGSGGVGQAAISIALSMNCTVFTTVGSMEKRDFLKSRYPELKDQHFANSRDLTFEEHVLNQTNGRGVDLVLNSLAEEKLQASVRCLAPCGRFLEIGQFDLSKNTPLGMSAFFNNVTFHGIQLDALTCNNPCSEADKARVAELVREGIASGAVRPLSTVLFSRDEAEKAFRFMASGKHIGKVVIQIQQEERDRKTIPASPLKVNAAARTYFYAHKSYVIAGGLGGFGLELADWMVTRGCRKLLLSSRSGVRTGYQRLCLHRWKHVGARVLVSNTDITTKDGAREVIQEAEGMGPVGGIFNLAMVLRDAPLEKQSPEAFETVYKPKVMVTQNLDELTRDLCPDLDHFVVFSSLACGRGNAEQSNYGYANSIMERICERRATDGLPGLAIQWGPIGEVGFVREFLGSDMQLGAILPQRMSSCMAVMDRFLNQSVPVVSSVVMADPSSTPAEGAKRNLVEIVTEILGVKDASSINPNAKLGELGMDSLVGVEVKQTIERDYDLVLSMQQVRELTVKRLLEISSGNVGAVDRATTTVKANALETAAVGKLYSKTDRSYTEEKGTRSSTTGQTCGPLQSHVPGHHKKVPTQGTTLPWSKLSHILFAKNLFLEMNDIKGDRPVFIVHPVEGNVDPLLELASHLPVRAIGVQRTQETPVHSLEETAAIYLQKIVEVQPAGPYHLVGYSFGAMVAFEIAVQLQASGATVGSLTCLDGTPRFGETQSMRQWSGLAHQNQEEKDSYFFCKFVEKFVNIEEAELRKLFKPSASFEAKRNTAVDVLLNNIPELRSIRQNVEKALSSVHESLEAAASYQVRKKLRGNIVLVKPSETESFAQQLPHDYGLSECCDGKVVVKVVNGTHENFFLGQGAEECAQAITHHMNQ
ncbi:fatty acid synthase-like isoform X2 [Haemaphysalis longicornis]